MVKEAKGRLRAEMSERRPKDCPLMGGEACTEKNCAWWNHMDEECSVATLGTLATIKMQRRER